MIEILRSAGTLKILGIMTFLVAMVIPALALMMYLLSAILLFLIILIGDLIIE